MNAWRSGETLEVPMSEQLARTYEEFRAAGGRSRRARGSRPL